MKAKTILFAVTLLMACATSLRAVVHTLTFHQKDGTTTELSFPGKFKQPIASEFLLGNFHADSDKGLEQA